MKHQYENNIGKQMPINNFGTANGKAIQNCILKKIANVNGMCYFLDLYTSDMEYIGSRWVTRHMYRYHVLGKSYCS